MTQIGAGEVCSEVTAYLEANLGGFLEGLKAPAVWRQLPSPEAMSTARYPAVAVSSPGLAGAPTRNRDKYSATWRVIVTVWVKADKVATRKPGEDAFSLVAAQTREYVKHVRTCLLAWGEGTWTDEGYAQVDAYEASGTLGAGFVELAVFVETAADLTDLPPGGPLPVVTSTAVTIEPKE